VAYADRSPPRGRRRSRSCRACSPETERRRAGRSQSPAPCLPLVRLLSPSEVHPRRVAPHGFGAPPTPFERSRGVPRRGLSRGFEAREASLGVELLSRVLRVAAARRPSPPAPRERVGRSGGRDPPLVSFSSHVATTSGAPVATPPLARRRGRRGSPGPRRCRPRGSRPPRRFRPPDASRPSRVARVVESRPSELSLPGEPCPLVAGLSFRAGSRSTAAFAAPERLSVAFARAPTSSPGPLSRP
jgi:hypothetical protein